MSQQMKKWDINGELFPNVNKAQQHNHFIRPAWADSMEAAPTMVSSITAPETSPNAAQTGSIPKDSESSGDGATAGVPGGSIDDLPDSSGINIETEEAITMAPFREWRSALEDRLLSAADGLMNACQAVQSQSDADSVFVRGEAGWRKHVALRNDQLDETLHRELELLTTQVARHADSAVDALSECLARSHASAKRALAKQADMYQDKLRRTRTALKKEMDRFATLETCLRAEQARQREVLHEQKIKEITDAHHDREAHLHATLRDLRAAYNNVEVANEQLLEALRASRRESEQLKNTLMNRGSSSPTSKHSSHRGSSSVFGANSPGRGSVDTTSSVLKNMAMTASEIVEQNLRQSLATANKELASAKQQIVELEREQRASDKREQQAQDATVKVQEELARATNLLAEAKSELVDGAERIAQLEKEREIWGNERRELQFRLEASGRRVEDLSRVNEAQLEYVDEMERRVQQLELRSTRLHALEDAFIEWKSHSAASNNDLGHIVAEFVAGDGIALDDMYSDSQTLTKSKLRLEFEKRFSDQLGLRVAHERKRVLARIEMLCSREKQNENEPIDLSSLLSRSPSRTGDKKKRFGKRNGSSDYSRSLYLLLSRLVRDAYEDLGVCVGAWSETDLDALHANARRLEKEIERRDEQIVIINTQLEVQRITLARSELLQSEKEVLIAELTDRCRQLRNVAEELNGTKEETIKRAGIPATRQPLTVYGISQPIESKLGCRSPSISAFSTQPRPMSAAPSFPPASVSSRAIPSPSRLGSLGSNGLAASAAKSVTGRWTKPIQEEDVPEHVRSVLKSQLMKSEPNNQQDGGVLSIASPSLGADGVLEIFQRRRQRR